MPFSEPQKAKINRSISNLRSQVKLLENRNSSSKNEVETLNDRIRFLEDAINRHVEIRRMIDILRSDVAVAIKRKDSLIERRDEVNRKKDSDAKTKELHLIETEIKSLEDKKSSLEKRKSNFEFLLNILSSE